MTPQQSKSDLFLSNEPEHKQSYNAFPKDGQPMRGYDLGTLFPENERPICGQDIEAAVLHSRKNDVLCVWDPETKARVFAGTYCGGGNGHMEFDLVDYMDVVNKGDDYNPGMVWMQPLNTKGSIESDKLYIFQRIGQVVDGKLQPDKPKVLKVHYDG